MRLLEADAEMERRGCGGCSMGERRKKVGIESKAAESGRSRAHHQETTLTHPAAGTALHHASGARLRTLRVHFQDCL